MIAHYLALNLLFTVDASLSQFWKRSELHGQEIASFFHGTTETLYDGKTYVLPEKPPRRLLWNVDHNEVTIRATTNVTFSAARGGLKTDGECSVMFMDGREGLKNFNQ